VKRIRIKHANWGTGTITFNATTTNLAAGNYTYTATDANGCSITVTINGLLKSLLLQLLLNPNVLVKRIRSIKHANRGTGTVTFNATATTNLAVGNYTYTATDANGCSKSITVTIKAALQIALLQLLSPNVLVKRIRSIKYTNWNWTFNATATTNLAAGNHTYTLLCWRSLNQ
jgi:hypothetical protein